MSLLISKEPKSAGRKSPRITYIKSRKVRYEVTNCFQTADVIAAFHLVGDIFGLVNGESHRFTAEAVVETTLRLVKRKSLYAALNSDAVVSRTLRTMTANNLQHAENHMLLLGRKTSLEKVAAFLIEMDSRLTAAGVMTLPMMRRDIGDYLGLTVETVARELSRMRRAGVLGFISKNQREIVILNRKRLATFDSLG
jgi:CRP/FNR family transcriptional regulator, nitrogen fixation regulation protein